MPDRAAARVDVRAADGLGKHWTPGPCKLIESRKKLAGPQDDLLELPPPTEDVAAAAVIPPPPPQTLSTRNARLGRLALVTSLPAFAIGVGRRWAQAHHHHVATRGYSSAHRTRPLAWSARPFGAIQGAGPLHSLAGAVRPAVSPRRQRTA